jgi:MFS family permease
MDWGQSRNHLRSAPRSAKPNPVDVENHRHRDATAGGLYLHPSCFESRGQSLTDEGTTSALFLTLTASNSSRGKAYEHFSLHLVFILSIFIFEAGSLVCAPATNSMVPVCGRASQGLGGA